MKEISPSYFLKQIAISKISPFLVSVQAFVFGVKFFNEIFFSVFPIEFWLIVDGFNNWDFHVVEGVAWEIEVKAKVVSYHLKEVQVQFSTLSLLQLQLVY